MVLPKDGLKKSVWLPCQYKRVQFPSPICPGRRGLGTPFPLFLNSVLITCPSSFQTFRLSKIYIFSEEFQKKIKAITAQNAKILKVQIQSRTILSQSLKFLYSDIVLDVERDLLKSFTRINLVLYCHWLAEWQFHIF